MITLKLKYRLKDEQDMSLIHDYQKQYSSCLHFLYNRISDNPSITEKELRLLYNNVNNCSLINKWLFQCAIGEAKQIYNKECEAKQDNNRYASIDLGLNNLCTLTSNTTQSIIVDGKCLKSINQHYNKTKAKLQSKLSNNKHTSKRISRLTLRRNRKIIDYMHKINTLCIMLTICIK